jgi:hypothetical protein
MQTIGDTRFRCRPAHMPVEMGTADGKTKISCAGPRCDAWNPRPFDSRREAQFWYDRHLAQPLIQHL